MIKGSKNIRNDGDGVNENWNGVRDMKHFWDWTYTAKLSSFSRGSQRERLFLKKEPTIRRLPSTAFYIYSIRLHHKKSFSPMYIYIIYKYMQQMPGFCPEPQP